MPKFDVSLHFSRFYELEADTERQAIEKANDYAFDEILESNYSDENFFDDVAVGLTKKRKKKSEYVDYKLIK